MCKYKVLILGKEKQVEYDIYSLHINIYVYRHIGEMSDTMNTKLLRTALLEKEPD